jgi:hypothetical protein
MDETARDVESIETKRGYETRMENESLFAVWRRRVPDGRTRDARGQISSPLGLITPIFCSSCGTGMGGIYGEIPHAAMLCDRCHATHGGLPDVKGIYFQPAVSPEAMPPHGG